MDYIYLSLAAHDVEQKSIAFVISVSIFSIIVTSVALCGNLTVMIAIIKDHRLRSASNLFFVSLACSDTFLSSISLPVFTLYWMKGEWLLGDAFCNVWLISDSTACTAGLFTIYSIAFDRYLSVTKPVAYRRFITKTKIILIIAITWCAPLVLFTTLVLLYNPRGVIIPEKDCLPKYSYNRTLVTILNLIRFWIPTALMLVLYWKIFQVARYMSRKKKTTTEPKQSTFADTSYITSYVPGGSSTRLNPYPDTNNNRLISSLKACVKYAAPSNGHGNQMPSSLVNPKPKLSSSFIDNPYNIDHERNGSCMHAKNQIYGDEKKNHSTEKSLKNEECYTDNVMTTSMSPLPTTTIKGSQYNYNNNSSKGSGTGSHKTHEAADHDHLSDITHMTTRTDHSNYVVNRSILFEGSSVDSVEPTTRSSIRKESIRHVANINELNNEVTENPNQPNPRNAKGIKTISSIVTPYMIFLTPYYLLVLVPVFCGYNCVPSFLFQFCYYSYYFNSAVNPFVYAFANEKLRAIFKRLWRCK